MPIVVNRKILESKITTREYKTFNILNNKIVFKTF